MHFKGISFIFIVSAICLAHANALPRDSGVLESDNVSINPDLREMKVISTETVSQSGIPGRVTCPYDEATEDTSCQELCLPKGYSYGLCVSGTCSCL
ncbi:jg9402 [Pararge aegeria aegeria]|uniref:Jg9402 protein n=2 Tax=Pararge aegeria TaxID=116150 RepID=A0A8S4RXS9_9NEOP|nr:jg9402 [Pararge aegeria aegeria]